MLSMLWPVFLVYVVILALAYCFQRSLVFYPSKIPVMHPKQYGLDMQEVYTETSDGLRLKHWFKAPEVDGATTVVIFHGNAGDIAERGCKAHNLYQQGYGVVLVEYRGYGGNPGTPSEIGFYDDGRSVMQYLMDQGFEPQDLILYGESIGSGTATQLAVEYDVKGLIIEAGFSSLGDVGAGHYPFLPVRLLQKDYFDNVAKIKKIKAPYLHLHGQLDKTVKYKHGKKLFDAAVEPKALKTYPDGAHMDLYDHGAGQDILAFISGLD